MKRSWFILPSTFLTDMGLQVSGRAPFEVVYRVEKRRGSRGGKLCWYDSHLRGKRKTASYGQAWVSPKRSGSSFTVLATGTVWQMQGAPLGEWLTGRHGTQGVAAWHWQGGQQGHDGVAQGVTPRCLDLWYTAALLPWGPRRPELTPIWWYAHPLSEKQKSLLHKDLVLGQMQNLDVEKKNFWKTAARQQELI